MSKLAFRYPLPADALRMFCHPAARSGLSVPMRMGAEIVAANGYLAIRCNRGAWMDADFPEAWTDFKTRVEKLPWARWDALKDDWRALDEVRGTLFRYAEIGVWLDQRNVVGKLAPSPVVWACGGIPVRLSMLQLISRLPRCEVYTGPCDRSDPLWFRFSGGRGVIARDVKLTQAPAFTVFEPMRDDRGQRIERRKTPAPRFEQPGMNWPPVDMTDADEGNGRTHFID